jgi:hypothetical protein
MGAVVNSCAGHEGYGNNSTAFVLVLFILLVIIVYGGFFV